MRWRVLAFLIILGLLLPITVEADVYSVDADIASYRHYDVWFSLEGGDQIIINIQETTGRGIDIYIFDEENYDLFSHSGDYDYLERYQNRAILSTTITVPESGTWYVAFWNTHGSTIHIEGTVRTESPHYEVLLAVAIIIIIAGACLCYAYKKKLHTYRLTPQPLAQEELFRFCPYCGTPRQSPDAQFCEKCGKFFNS